MCAARVGGSGVLIRGSSLYISMSIYAGFYLESVDLSEYYLCSPNISLGG